MITYHKRTYNIHKHLKREEKEMIYLEGILGKFDIVGFGKD